MKTALYYASLIGAAVFVVFGLAAITPLDQAIDATTSMSHDRIFSAIVLFLLAACAVKP